VKLLSISYEDGDKCPTIALKIDWEILGLALIAMDLFLTQTIFSLLFLPLPKDKRQRECLTEIGSEFSHLACEVKWQK